jgi:hypothetical protein
VGGDEARREGGRAAGRQGSVARSPAAATSVGTRPFFGVARSLTPLWSGFPPACQSQRARLLATSLQCTVAGPAKAPVRRAGGGRAVGLVIVWW